jgi:hypothetical protein
MIFKKARRSFADFDDTPVQARNHKEASLRRKRPDSTVRL